MTLSPPNHWGKAPLTDTPIAANSALNANVEGTERRNMERAQSQSSAPIRWATCTEKPVDAAAQSPQKSHVVVDTHPIEAEAFAPRLPTIAASMYCMTMAESWVTMAGTLNATVRRNCSPDVIGRPSRIRASRWSVFFFFSFMYVLGLFDGWL